MILCGTDFSQRATEAAEVAAALAARIQEQLLVLHALDEHAGTESAMEKLRAHVETLSEPFPTLHVETRVEAGHADEVLTGLASQSAVATPVEQRVRFIVVSSLGRRAPSRWVLGSIAERTAQTSSVPVLIVRSAKPFTSWLLGERPLRVAVGFEFGASSTAALRWVNELSRIAPCDIVICHVTSPTKERKRLGVSWALRAAKNFQGLEVLLRSDLRHRLTQHRWKSGWPTIRIKLGSGGRASTLAQLATEENADLLVVGSRQTHGLARLWQESVSRGALYHAPMSIACIPAQTSFSL